MSNPDNALPLYLVVVIVGIMLGPAWSRFIKSLQTTGNAVTSGSAAVTGQTAH